LPDKVVAVRPMDDNCSADIVEKCILHELDGRLKVKLKVNFKFHLIPVRYGLKKKKKHDGQFYYRYRYPDTRSLNLKNGKTA
jgi:hypothetical protein